MLCLVYEALLLTAVAFGATAVFLGLAHLAGHTLPRPLLQIGLIVVAGAYFVPQWRSGQTLAMRTWRLRVVGASGDALTTRQALSRYGAALLSWLLLGGGYLWALIDRDRQFLHDRLAGTRLIALPRRP